jgi:hypothetical protein
METIKIEENVDYKSNKKVMLYKDIFWEAPWNEWYLCINCWKNFNKKFLWSCSCWNSELEPFYKNKELKNTFTELSEKSWYKELIANILDKEVWFIWGWKSSLKELNNDKLWLDTNILDEVENNIKNIFPDFDENNFYYFAEIWVKDEYRWQDLAWNLYRKNLKELKENWEKYILVRTTRKSDVPYKWFLNEWYQDVYLYNDEQDRVILVYKI